MIGNTRQVFAAYGFFQLFNFLISVFDNVEFSNLAAHWLLLISFLATILLILFYITAFLIPQKAEELLAETYPEYKLVKNM